MKILGLNSVNSSVMPQIVPKNFVQSSLEHGPGTNSCKIHGFKNIHGIAAFVKPSVMGWDDVGVKQQGDLPSCHW